MESLGFLPLCTAAREVGTPGLCSCLVGLFSICRVPVSPQAPIAQTLGTIGLALYA